MSGRRTCGGIPDRRDTSITLRGGISAHWETACDEMPKASPTAFGPPAASMAILTSESLMGSYSKPHLPRFASPLGSNSSVEEGSRASEYGGTMGEEMGRALRAARRAKGLRQYQVAESLGVTREAVSQWETGRTEPSSSHLVQFAALVGTDVRALTQGQVRITTVTAVTDREPISILEDDRAGFRSAIPEEVRAADEERRRNPMAAMSLMPQDVPVYGIAVGGNDGDFSFNGEVVEYVRRPPGVRSARGVYALYVINDSMAERFYPGELIFVAPARTPSIGDFVVLQLFSLDNADREGGGPAFLKRLVKRTPTKTVVEQFNPAQHITFDNSRIKAMHRVLTTNELFGV